MLTMRDFWRSAQPYAEERVSRWGFRVHSRGIFVREQDRFWNGFAVVPSRNQPHSCYAGIGLHVPALRDRLKFIDQVPDIVGFEISHRLGTYREGARLVGLDEWYGFRNEKQLMEAMDRMFGHFEAWALPWYEQFQGLEDVAREFYRYRIEDLPEKRPPGIGPKAPDPFGWALYGWMLEEIGKKEDAHAWLRRAYDEVHRPLFVDAQGRPISKTTRGAKPVRHPDAEERLEELLRQSLQLPLS